MMSPIIFSHSNGCSNGSAMASVLKYHGTMWYNFAVPHFAVPNFAPAKFPPPRYLACTLQAALWRSIQQVGMELEKFEPRWTLQQNSTVCVRDQRPRNCTKPAGALCGIHRSATISKQSTDGVPEPTPPVEATEKSQIHTVLMPTVAQPGP